MTEEQTHDLYHRKPIVTPKVKFWISLVVDLNGGLVRLYL
jgi:hypothetical protein